MRCGVCHAPLRFKDISRKGGRMSPTYHPCPRLDDPAAHPARAAAKEASRQKVIAAEEKAARYLADFNELNEAGKGKTKRAERLLELSQKWLDKVNDLRGWGGEP